MRYLTKGPEWWTKSKGQHKEFWKKCSKMITDSSHRGILPRGIHHYAYNPPEWAYIGWMSNLCGSWSPKTRERFGEGWPCEMTKQECLEMVFKLSCQSLNHSSSEKINLAFRLQKQSTILLWKTCFTYLQGPPLKMLLINRNMARNCKFIRPDDITRRWNAQNPRSKSNIPLNYLQKWSKHGKCITMWFWCITWIFRKTQSNLSIELL